MYVGFYVMCESWPVDGANHLPESRLYYVCVAYQFSSDRKIALMKYFDGKSSIGVRYDVEGQ